MIFVPATTDHFIHRCSTVYSAALNIRKAFDSINHDEMFHLLSERGVPPSLVAVLQNWYRKGFVNVRLGSLLLGFFPSSIRAETRQYFITFIV